VSGDHQQLLEDAMAYKMLINGKLVDGAMTMDVVNPATGGVLATCPRADEAQLDEAVAAAKAAFPAWSALSFGERRKKLEAIADALETRANEFARLLTQEQGKPTAQAIGEVMGAVIGMRAFAAAEVEDKILRETDQERIIEQRTPLGVVGAIMPWNFPLLLMVMKTGPALITGNTIVAKPAPTTPLTSLLFAEMVADMLPPGVLNIIVDANDLGALMTKHKDIAKVSFTGSTATGKKVMESVSSSLKRLTLELGGNDAAIVLADVDVKAVAPKIFDAAMSNAGQICLATKRVYAHSSIYEELCGELARLAGEAVVDDGLKQGTSIGPIQNKMQYEKVKGFLEDARTNGNVIAGGQAMEREGYFIAPTIVRDIGDDARLVREEQFGPVLPVMSFEDVEDAIARTNDTDYGLGGSVWTGDVARGIAVASKVQSGTVWVNKWLDMPFDVPFRGAKHSGIGAENGQEGIEEYTQARIINVAL
jgi:acyl-CoA reductase-like NAD-dependent aldehyde dehydrogenase